MHLNDLELHYENYEPVEISTKYFEEAADNPYYWVAFGRSNGEETIDPLEDFFDTDEDRAAFWAALPYTDWAQQRDNSELPQVELKKRIVRRGDESWEILVPIDFQYPNKPLSSSASNVVKSEFRSTVDEKPQSKFGTREISDHSINIQLGCNIQCLYCWAAERAVSNGQVKSRDEWKNEQIKSMYFKKGALQFQKYDGVVMYPTTHDITRNFLNSHVKAVRGLLVAGNNLLICSKASLYCMEKIAKVCTDFQHCVTFMVTITSLDEAQSIFWEPNAPLPSERLAALKYLYEEGFETSVIIEPLLQGPCSAMGIYEAVSPFVTDSIWIGTMNSVDVRVDVSIPENARAVEAIKRYHSIDNLRFLYDSMKNLPKIKFKNSITRIFEKDSTK